MGRCKAFIGRGRNQAGVQRQHFVKPGRARPPMADNENGRNGNDGAVDAGPVNKLLDESDDRIHDRAERDVDRHRNSRSRYRIAIARQQLPPSFQRHSMPDPERPRSIAGIFVVTDQRHVCCRKDLNPT